MRHAFGVLLCLLVAASGGRLAWADGPWEGGWDTLWRDGGAHLELTQDGAHVTGKYKLYDGTIDAQAHDRVLEGQWREGSRNGMFRFDLAEDGRSFTGRFDTGEWWTGGRHAARPLVVAPDQSGVRETFRTFLTGGNLAHAGLLDQLGLSVAVMDFSANPAALQTGEKVAAAKQLMDLVEQTTFKLWSLPGKRTPGDSFDTVLHQDGTSATLPLSFRRHDGKWWLLTPSPEVMEASRTALLARSGGKPPRPDAYLDMRDARDTVSTFQSAFVRWDEGGAEQALGTLDTSRLAAATRHYEGLLAVQYLKRVIDRVGQVAPQEIPDDPADRQPYVIFRPSARADRHRAGKDRQRHRLALHPETVRSAPALYAAVQASPVTANGALPPPQSAFFKLRNWVVGNLPSLLRPVGVVEAWQIVFGFLFLAVAFAVALVLAAIVLALVRWEVGGQKVAAERSLVWPLRIALTAILFKLAIPSLGWPEEVRTISAPIHAVIITFFGVWAGWQLITAVGTHFSSRAERSATRLDDIVVSLVLGALRLGMLFVAISYVADQLSIPTNGIIAGLGISGLAVAFASKETLSNVFGAGILVSDHPFKRGDWIVADSVQGSVEHVGIRSTRVRTAEDTVMVVPNGKLADASINNWGTRRHRLSRAKLLVGYGGTPRQLDDFIAGLRRILAETPAAVDSRSQVGVTGLSEKGIEVDVTTYLNVASLGDERQVNHALMLRILTLAEELGLRLGAADAAPPASSARSREPETVS